MRRLSIGVAPWFAAFLCVSCAGHSNGLQTSNNQCAHKWPEKGVFRVALDEDDHIWISKLVGETDSRPILEVRREGPDSILAVPWPDGDLVISLEVLESYDACTGKGTATSYVLARLSNQWRVTRRMAAAIE